MVGRRRIGGADVPTAGPVYKQKCSKNAEMNAGLVVSVREYGEPYK